MGIKQCCVDINMHINPVGAHTVVLKPFSWEQSSFVFCSKPDITESAAGGTVQRGGPHVYSETVLNLSGPNSILDKKNCQRLSRGETKESTGVMKDVFLS